MSGYTVREVESLLGISRAVIANLIAAGFVAPSRGKRREYRFSFRDLVILRTAQGLNSAKIPARKIARSLRRLRQALPEQLPLSGLRIAALGNDVVVKEGSAQWRADSGQYLFDFEVAPAQGSVRFLSRGPAPAARSAEDWFDLGYSLEEREPERARAAYEQALAIDPHYVSAYVNLGRLLHAAGDLGAAQRCYRVGLRHQPDDALLNFNLGVLLEDMTRPEEAARAYESALRADGEFADAHFNLARLRDARGHTQDALRHYNEYRRLQAVPTT